VCTGQYTFSSAQQVVTATIPSSTLPREPMYCRATYSLACPDFRSPESSITNTPSPCAAVLESAINSSILRSLIAS
jgi:hypothetical protein